MDSKYLEKLWAEITFDGMSAYAYKRIDSKSFPDLCIGINSDSNRCVVLELPKGHAVDFQSTHKQNLSLYFYKDTDCIVLELLDSTFNSLFSDLAISLYQSIKNIKNVSEYSSIFIQSFHKWSEFFHENSHDRLNEDTIKGLFGELIILRGLVIDSPSSRINDVLLSWHGPYDRGHDFVFDDKNIEVKTKNTAITTIKISSEYQLDNEPGKEHELVVVSVERDSVNGISLSDILELIKTSVINKLGDMTIIYNAVKQKGLTTKNINEYDEYKFMPIKKDTYNALIDGFPKLVKSNIPTQITSVKYKLNLSLMDKYLVKSGDF